MDAAVKPRRYHAPQRQARARETRRALLAAARARFLAQGYVATRVAAVARDAGVAEATAFAVFGSKRGLLTAVIGAAVGGDDAPVPLAARAEWRAVLTPGEPRQQLRRLAALLAAIHARSWALIELARGAAAVEPELAELLRQGGEGRLADCRTIIDALRAQGALRPGLDPAAAAEILWVQGGPEVYRMLVVVRGWREEDYRDWLAETLAAALLPRGPEERRG